MTQKDVTYPPGVREISDELSTEELVRRLKECAQAFQNMSQEDDNSAYIPLAEHFVSETFLEHPSRDVRVLVACCIADVFRVYAPDAPYKDLDQLKVIFEYFVDQLRGLEDPSNPLFKRYFYLLENLSCVKTFNICVELEDNQKILCRLFKLMFKIINMNHSAKVKKFILEMLSPLISEADGVSQELLDVILSQIIEPIKTQNRNACTLAQDVLKRNISTLEPYIQTFFNNALVLGKTLESEVACHLYELIYELNGVCPSMLIVVLQQLESKLKSNEEKERLDVTQVLARMFSDKNSTMIEENKNLWSCFLARFNDISPQVRIRCVKYCKSFLLNHPESKDDITEQLKQRHRDPDENVRYEVVVAIIGTAKENFSSVNEELLSFIQERTRDKKFKIRKESLLGLAVVYKDQRNNNLSMKGRESIAWVKNKVLHAYYQTSLEDRLLVERILHTCLVPYQKPMEERMKLLYQLFCSVDDYAVKAFKEIMKCQSILRNQVRTILEVIQREKNDARQRAITSKVSLLSKNLQDPAKSYEYILKFCGDLELNMKLRSLVSVILNGNITCSEAEIKVKEILKSLGHPVQTNAYYMIIKQLLERIAPVMIDKEGICLLVKCVKDSLLGNCEIEAELGLQNSSIRGLELLWVLTFVFPTAFQDEEIFNNLLLFLHVEDESSADIVLQILMNISSELENNFPEFSAKLLPILENFVETGSPKQAKHAVYCINSMVIDKEKVFGNIIENLKKHFTLDSQYFRTALVSVGHIAFLCHDMFAADLKMIVAQIVVKDLLMLDKDLPRGGNDTWGPLDTLPDETKVKIEGMKVMVRWLAGLKDMVQPAISTLRLLTTVILHDGDLMERQHTAPIENSWMRLSAATCMLKLCQEPNYAKVITLEQFQVLGFVMNDKCPGVRDRFAQKVHKGLFALKLPLEFLAIFCLAALDERKEFKTHVKGNLLANINKRKECIKNRALSGEKLRQFLPDYALPYAIHLLAHSPFFSSYDDVPALTKIKECLWFIMEPLMTKNENYDFSFYKRLLENMKQTKDKQAPDDPNTNEKLYAVCDLALSIVLTKTSGIVLKDFPVDPALPSKLFTDPDLSYSNFKTYLPSELIPDKTLKSGIGIEIFEGSKETATPSQSMATANDVMMENTSHDDSNISDLTSIENDSVPSTVPARRRGTRSATLRQQKKHSEKVNNSKAILENAEASSIKTRRKNVEKVKLEVLDTAQTNVRKTRGRNAGPVDDSGAITSDDAETINNSIEKDSNSEDVLDNAEINVTESRIDNVEEDTEVVVSDADSNMKNTRKKSTENVSNNDIILESENTKDVDQEENSEAIVDCTDTNVKNTTKKNVEKASDSEAIVDSENTNVQNAKKKNAEQVNNSGVIVDSAYTNVRNTRKKISEKVSNSGVLFDSEDTNIKNTRRNDKKINSSEVSLNSADTNLKNKRKWNFDKEKSSEDLLDNVDTNVKNTRKRNVEKINSSEVLLDSVDANVKNTRKKNVQKVNNSQVIVNSVDTNVKNTRKKNAQKVDNSTVASDKAETSMVRTRKRDLDSEIIMVEVSKPNVKRARKKDVAVDVLDITENGPNDNSSISDNRNVGSITNSETKARPQRSARLLSTSSTKSSSSSSPSKQNGIISDFDISSLCSPDVQHSLKECNVSLRKDEVERYMASSTSASDSFDGTDFSDDDNCQQTATKSKSKSKKVTDSPAILKKRKREDSQVNRSVKSKPSSKLNEKPLSNSSKSTPSSSFPKSNNTLKKGNKLPLVNGNRGMKVSQKGNTKELNQQKSQRSDSESPLKRSQRTQGKVNLRKR